MSKIDELRKNVATDYVPQGRDDVRIVLEAARAFLALLDGVNKIPNDYGYADQAIQHIEALIPSEWWER